MNSNPTRPDFLFKQTILFWLLFEVRSSNILWPLRSRIATIAEKSYSYQGYYDINIGCDCGSPSWPSRCFHDQRLWQSYPDIANVWAILFTFFLVHYITTNLFVLSNSNVVVIFSVSNPIKTSTLLFLAIHGQPSTSFLTKKQNGER